MLKSIFVLYVCIGVADILINRHKMSKKEMQLYILFFVIFIIIYLLAVYEIIERNFGEIIDFFGKE